eukprot:3224844-Rhodomonas_salina.13
MSRSIIPSFSTGCRIAPYAVSVPGVVQHHTLCQYRASHSRVLFRYLAKVDEAGRIEVQLRVHLKCKRSVICNFKLQCEVEFYWTAETGNSKQKLKLDVKSTFRAAPFGCELVGPYASIPGIA